MGEEEVAEEEYDQEEPDHESDGVRHTLTVVANVTVVVQYLSSCNLSLSFCSS